MLVALRLSNFALIEQLELGLEPGFNVLTGETGAGKSIVVGALELVLGRRARAEVVRPGATQAVIEAMFDLEGSPALQRRLGAAGVACDGELVVRRVIQPSGRSRAYLNGQLTTVGELAALGGELADITSQHDGVALKASARHIDYLDRYGKLGELRGRLSERVAELRERDQRIAAIERAGRDRGERESFLRFQLEAIGSAAPQRGELEALRGERERLRHTERLAGLTGGAAQALDGTDRPLCDKLGRVAADMSAAAEIDAELSDLAAELDGCWGRLREAATELDRYAGKLEADPERLQEVQGRMYELEELQRRFGPTLDDVLAHEAEIRAELDALGSLDERLPPLRAEREGLLEQAASLARKLSKSRRQAARRLSAAITAELGQLGMGEARVVVEVSRASGPDGDAHGAAPGQRSAITVDGALLGSSGIDRVQFLIAPGSGVTPRPLNRIASGGELSRALLALKAALGQAELEAAPGQPQAGHRAVGVQVFDEVDAGVGGVTADEIGRAIARVASRRQVLCITHLGAIAAHADAQFAVRKHRGGRVARSEIERVTDAARVAEIARMLTGDQASGSSAAAASELLERGRREAATTPPA